MQQISISQIQRNLHTLDHFDIIEVIDKKRNKVKGYFIDSKYVALVEEIARRIQQANTPPSTAAGMLHAYADPDKIGHEEGAWQRAAVAKHRAEPAV